MRNRLIAWTWPLALVLLTGAPAAAQVRIGVELGDIHIRIAPEPPPAPRIERRLVQPSRDHVWIEGFWDRPGDRWIWCPGHWDRPARPGIVWVRPRYLQEDGAYRYEPGHWSHQRLVEGEDYTRWHRDHGRRDHGDRGHGDHGHGDHGHGDHGHDEHRRER